MIIAVLMALAVLIAMVAWVAVLVGRLRGQVRRSRPSVDAVGDRFRAATQELEEEQAILQVEVAAVQTSAGRLAQRWRARR